MQSVALSWLVLELSNSAWKTGLVTVLQTAPVLCFTLYGGVIADRVDKRRWLIVLQVLFLCEALSLGTLTATHTIRVPLIYALALFSGSISAFEIPIRQAYLMDLVGRADLMNAIALNSSAFNLSRVIGPAFAASATALLGAAACFFLNAASFFAVLIGLVMIDPRQAHARAASKRAGYRDGINHVLSTPLPRTLVMLTTVLTLFATSLVAILSVYARDVLKTRVGGYGGLMSAFGVGAAGAALTLAWAGHRLPRAKVALWAGIVLGLALMFLGLARHYPTALALLAVAGLCMALSAIMTNTILQTGAPDHIRGQVVGLYSFIVIGMAPFGSLQAAWMAERFGASTAIGVGGVICFVAAATGAWRRRIELANGEGERLG
jgi:MFS family permease